MLQSLRKNQKEERLEKQRFVVTNINRKTLKEIANSKWLIEIGNHWILKKLVTKKSTTNSRHTKWENLRMICK